MLGHVRLPVSAARIAISVWFAAMLLLGSALLAKHVVALPAPEQARLARSLSALRATDARGKWLAIHVLYAECRCSRKIALHLTATARPPAWAELVLWVGNPAPDPALERRFAVRRVTSVELARLGVEAAPLLVVLDPADRLAYAGGYSTRKQGPVLDDLRILDAAQRSHRLEGLPVFGCAVSERLKQELAILPGL